MLLMIFFFKQKTAYEMRISDWISDVGASDLGIAKFACDGTKDSGATRRAGVIDDNSGVLVEGDVRAVIARKGLLSADDDGRDDLALLDRALRRGLLDGCRDVVAHIDRKSTRLNSSH